VLDLTLYPQIAFPSEIFGLPFHATEATSGSKKIGRFISKKSGDYFEMVRKPTS
jgi:hypothetical protein